jgi:hypothetical protein
MRKDISIESVGAEHLVMGYLMMTFPQKTAVDFAIQEQSANK